MNTTTINKWLVGLATVVHLLPHPFGVSPVGAVALYAGAYGGKWSSWLVPLVPLTIAALLTGFYDPVVMAFVFAGFALSTLACVTSAPSPPATSPKPYARYPGNPG